ncbi:protein NKG7-like [Rhineura floridana]|uniref:protein NKG7-like n=1 Tax=Rhineura floridana TaxID=261503 RepID=UPI002AC808E1|nr:protein NKG7-like [Rhineura floridana]
MGVEEGNGHGTKEPSGEAVKDHACDPTSVISLSVVSHRLDFLTEPLRIGSGICSAGSLLLEFTSLSTPYWVLESTNKGLLHSGLWKVCLDPDCTLYWFSLLALPIHFTRAFLLIACFCGLISLLCICISFERDLLFRISLVRTAAAFSFCSGLFILIGMSIFTYVHKRSQSYTRDLVIFGSSYGLGWASIPMYVITGILLMLTHKTTIY